MKYYLQESLDGKVWKNANCAVNGRREVMEYYYERFPSNSLIDWQVGSYLVTRHGVENKPATHYRFVDKNENEVGLYLEL